MIPVVAVILCLCIAFEKSKISDLEKSLAEEKVKNQKYRQLNKAGLNFQVFFFKRRFEQKIKLEILEVWQVPSKTQIDNFDFFNPLLFDP